MDIKEFESKAREWEKSVEDVLIEITNIKDAKDLRFPSDCMPTIKAFNNMLIEARNAIKASEALTVEEK